MLQTEWILHKSGITSNYKGYWLLDSAVDIILKNPSAANSIVDIVYKSLAEKFEISVVSVERNIHTSIARAWEVAPQRVNAALGRRRVWQPTASEFILLLVDKVKDEL